jgi:hypothetical protein
MRRLAATLLLCAGCAFLPRHESDGPSGQDIFSERWIGKAEDDVLVQYGRPDDELTLSTGNTVKSYHREVNDSSSSASGSATRNISDFVSKSRSTTVYCDRRFEIDKTTRRVVRAVITGSSCDYWR